MSESTPPRVLDVGQCDMDHGNISRLLKDNFGALVDRAKGIDQVMYMTGFYDYDLVLVNRIFDADGSEGQDLIRRMKESDDLRDIPVMLISNYVESQESAVQAGAVMGFGKDALDAPETVSLLAAHLGSAEVE